MLGDGLGRPDKEDGEREAENAAEEGGRSNAFHALAP